jgi:hypothetical protein
VPATAIVSAVELKTSEKDTMSVGGKQTDRDVHKTLVLGCIANFCRTRCIKDIALVYFFKVFVCLGVAHICRKSTFFLKKEKKNVRV